MKPPRVPGPSVPCVSVAGALAASLAGAAIVMATVACGSDGASGPSTAGDDGGGTSPVVIVSPPGTSSDGGAADASDVGAGVMNRPDASVVDCNEAIDQSQVFVSTGAGSSTTGSCSPTTPCTTIAAALEAAAKQGASVVYLDVGTYTEQVTLPATIRRLRGGWQRTGGTWSVICSDARLSSTIIAASPGADRTIIATDLGGTTSIEAVTVTSKSAAAAGETIYGIFATGASTTLNLVDTSITVVRGGDGADGAGGTAGSGGGSSCDVGVDPAQPPGAATVATAGVGVSYGVSGAMVATGGAGKVGGSGGNGIAGMETCGPQYDCIREDPGCETSSDGTVCAPAGTPGCGGGPGGAGGGGHGGGSSVALYAYDATVSMSGGALQPGNGGAGGQGGAGGSGGTGSSSVTMTVYETTGCDNNCGKEVKPLKGTPGTTGADGAIGPNGGGGAGGDSFAYFANANNVNVGNAGIGTAAAGPGGHGTSVPPGPDGLAGVHN